MEQNNQLLLEMMDRPAFIVRNGIVQHANQLAKNRLIQIGDSIHPMIEKHASAYEALQDGCLYLSLDFGTFSCGASVTRHEYGDIFLMDRDQDIAQLQALALAGQQIKMPLSNIMLLADELLPHFQNDPKEKEMAAELNRGLFQLLRIVGNMTDAERYVSNHLTNLQTTNLTSFLSNVFNKAQTLLENRTSSLTYEIMKENVFTLVDRDQLERAILNMLSNAVKFAPKDSVITAKAEVSGKLVRISVENMGDGIPPHVRSSIFHRYQREPSIEDSRHGLGLGMTLIRSVAALHGGTVLVDQPQGTRVTMTVAIRKFIPGGLRSPVLKLSDYSGGRDNTLVELSDSLSPSNYK